MKNKKKIEMEEFMVTEEMKRFMDHLKLLHEQKMRNWAGIKAGVDKFIEDNK